MARVLLPVQRSGDSRSPRVVSSIIASSRCTSCGVGLGNRLAPASRTANTTGPDHPGFDFPDSLMDRLARQTARAADETYASPTQSFGFVRRHQAARAFIQMRPDGAKLRPKLGKSTHS